MVFNMPLFPPFDYLAHRKTCLFKQDERTRRLDALPNLYYQRVTPEERGLLDGSLLDIVNHVQSGRIKPVEVLRAYGKLAVRAHEEVNCLTEIMIETAEIELMAAKDSQYMLNTPNPIDLRGRLAGVPVSLKDTIQIDGYHNSLGYSKYADQEFPIPENGNIVKLLRTAGAIPFVKTNVPTTLLSFESSNDVFGRTLNPHNVDYSPGGSSGGEAALLALGGSRIGIGSDVAGSVRLPAHWSGCFALRCSTGRWPKLGIRTSMAGQEGVASVYSPMARTWPDLVLFTGAIMSLYTEAIDYSLAQIKWRESLLKLWDQRPAEFITVGVLWDDGVVTPSPACHRALQLTALALRGIGCRVKAVTPPSPYNGLVLASQLLGADGGETFLSHMRTGETNDPGAAQMAFYAGLPSFVRYAYYLWVRYIRKDILWAGLLRHFGRKTVAQQWKLVAQRDAYRAQWADWHAAEGFDILLTVPHSMPALPHGAMRNAVSSCGYTFLFNLLDYTAGVMPVTKVNPKLDQLPKDFDISKLNGVARGAYMYYDADKMSGLPVGIQVVGGRMDEEKVLAMMGRIEAALKHFGTVYELINVLD